MVRWWPLGTVERRHSYTFGCGPAHYSATWLVQLARSVMDAHDGRIVREQPDHVIERAIVGNAQRADERRPRHFPLRRRWLREPATESSFSESKAAGR